MLVEFVVDSLPCSGREGFFSGYSGFVLSSKTYTSKFQLDPERTDILKTSSVEFLSASWVNKLRCNAKKELLDKFSKAV